MFVWKKGVEARDFVDYGCNYMEMITPALYNRFSWRLHYRLDLAWAYFSVLLSGCWLWHPFFLNLFCMTFTNETMCALTDGCKDRDLPFLKENCGGFHGACAPLPKICASHPNLLHVHPVRNTESTWTTFVNPLRKLATYLPAQTGEERYYL